MKNISNLMTSNSDNWKTPSILYNYFIDKGFIDMFPYCSNLDQYGITYYKRKLFCNPPYSHINTKKFKEYIVSLINNHNLIYLLVPSRTDTDFFHLVSKYASSFVFFKGRLHFNDSKNGATFPSCLIVIDTLSLFSLPFGNSYFLSVGDFVKKWRF